MDKIKIPAGNTSDVWFGVNITGTIHYAIRTIDGDDRAKFWWIKWGLGVYTARVDTVVYMSYNVLVDFAPTFEW